MAASLLGLLVSGLWLGLWLLLLAAALHLLRLGLWACFAPVAPTAITPLADEDAALPFITVQIPLRNERFVARRALLAAGALDWPLGRFEIQVLDDSDDDTRQIVDAAAAELHEQGRAVTVLRRAHRSGYKAGALDEALPQARGELIAILDADFVPAPDFLRRLAAHFRDAPQLAFVQGRWSFLNERQNLLTRVEALILHGLMLVEQPYLSAHGKPIQFNGTGGLWRRSVLEQAGGFRGESASVTEDMDLSYRACLLGYRGKHLPEVAVPTELPATMAAFRVQQQRWVRGGAEVLRSLLHKLGSGRLSSGERLTLLGHLLRHARQPYLSLSLLWLPVLCLGWLRPAFCPPGGLGLALGGLILSLVVYYGAALRRLGRSPAEALLLAPLLVPLSMGLSLGLSVALLSGLFVGRAGSEFVRTPKTGGTATDQAAVSPAYKPRRDRLARLEVLLGLAYAALSGLLLFRSDLKSALGLGLLVAGGLLWVGIGTLVSFGWGWRSRL